MYKSHVSICGSNNVLHKLLVYYAIGYDILLKSVQSFQPTCVRT